MKIVTIGSRIFVTSFQLAGVQGIVVDNPSEAFSEIKKLADDPDVGLVLISDDISAPINTDLTKLTCNKIKTTRVLIASCWQRKKGSRLQKNAQDHSRSLNPIVFPIVCKRQFARLRSLHIRSNIRNASCNYSACK
ncbi:V-type ATP synthase subunit F [Candidatus Nitrosotenuis chungbukensis]|uniref:V-type ATP synthase subunit F n=1 Tax=Candidatus Nitrosotenuis chungbukensis TaxID=1353246 RepID=UPI002672DCE7|nr:V-type ATP synthase subunit F [Candidatus Nitrosotenuis chungbukensis]WKT57733.1 V-type ATP synthase subunit F [Candidatus Nitrosotenuis chungbukensis]